MARGLTASHLMLPMKRLLLFLMACSPAFLSARGDDQTQSVQQALKDQGFYYGSVDGQPGPETDAAVRRYQIRQGLEVTGKLDAETLSSLKVGGDSGDSTRDTVQAVPPPSADSGDSHPVEESTPSPRVVQSDRDFLRRHPNGSPTPADDEAAAQAPQGDEPQPQGPAEPQPAEPPQAENPPIDQGQVLPPAYANFFRRTPYQNAPPGVQRDTVQRAQIRLARQGFYRGVADGELSDQFSRAIAAYQEFAQLHRSARLDMDTLEDMNLLPHRRVLAGPPPPPAYVHDPRDVYRGIWVHGGNGF